MSFSLEPCLPLGTLDGAWERIQKNLPPITSEKKNGWQIIVVGAKFIIFEITAMTILSLCLEVNNFSFRPFSNHFISFFFH